MFLCVVIVQMYPTCRGPHESLVAGSHSRFITHTWPMCKEVGVSWCCSIKWVSVCSFVAVYSFLMLGACSTVMSKYKDANPEALAERGHISGRVSYRA